MWWRLRAKSIRNVVWAAFNGRVQLKPQAVASPQHVIGRLALATSCINYQQPARPACMLP